MKETYARSYRELYECHWWWRARERFLVDQLRRELKPGTAGRVLDVGCGDGLFFEKLSEFGEVDGVELDRDVIRSAAQHSRRIHVGPFDQTFSPNYRYSAILMLDVLEHLHDPANALRHALALLEADGKLIVTVPAFNLLWTNHDDINEHLVRYTKKSLRDLAGRTDFHIDRCRYFFFWLFPAKLMMRLAEAILCSSPRPSRVPPSFVNTMLIQLSRLEELVLGRLPIPLGSSLLAIGHRNSTSSSA